MATSSAPATTPVPTKPPFDGVAVAKAFHQRGYKLLVLVDDELGFLEAGPPPTDATGNHDGGGGCAGTTGTTSSDRDGSGTSPARLPQLFGIVAHSVDTVIGEWEARATKVVLGNDIPRGLRVQLPSALVHAHEVGPLLPALAKGEPRLVDIIEGVDYAAAPAATTTATGTVNFTSAIDPDRGSGDDSHTRAHTPPRYRVLYEADEWVEFRRLLPRGILYQAGYAQTAIGCAFGMSRPTGKKGVAARLAVPAGRDYVEHMVERAARCAEVEVAWRGLPPFPPADPTQLHAAVGERQLALRTVFRNAKRAKRLNLCAVSPEQHQALEGWCARLRHEACDRWADSVPAPTIDAAAAAGTAIPDTLGFSVPIPDGSLMFVAQSGSAMYNLATATSDVDYSLVFASPTRALMCDPAQVQHLSSTVAAPMGSDKAGVIEYDIKEFGSFLLELCKGNPRNIELLFLPPDEAVCVSHDWHWLRQIRRGFLTGRCVQQYMGFVADRLKRTRRLLDEAGPGPLSDEAEAGCAKLLYHAHHKLFDLQRIVAYQDPLVRLPDDSAERDFIMRIRETRPLAGDLEPRKLVADIEAAIDKVKCTRDTVDAERRANGNSAQPVRADEVELAPLIGLLRNVRRSHLHSRAGVGPSTVGMRQRSRSSSSLAAAAATSTSATAHVVKERLVRAETEHDVHIIFAAECSSRNLGTSHAGSDHDVVALFVHRTGKYFSMFPVRKAIRCTYEEQDGEPEVDIELLEVRHAFELCAQNNPTLVEALTSPHVYRTFDPASTTTTAADPPLWLDTTREMLRTGCNRHAFAWACWSQSKSNFKAYVETVDGNFVLQKKYIHVVRKVLLCQWLIAQSTQSLWPPPLSIAELLHTVDTLARDEGPAFECGPGVCAEIESMLAPERLPLLCERGPHRAVLDRWICERQAGLKSFLERHPRGADPTGQIEAAKYAWDALLVPLARVASEF